MARLLFASSPLVALLCAAASCEPFEPPMPPCAAAEERCIVPGHTSGGVCTESGLCLGTDVPCTADRECYFPIQPGDSIPAWQRPQGGLGTRLNARLEGFDEADPENVRGTFEALYTILVGPYQLSNPSDPSSRVTCTPDICEQNLGCECDENAGFSCVERPGQEAVCAELVCYQVMRNFAAELDGFGAIVVAEQPVRFVNDLGLSELDGREVDLLMAIETQAGEVRSRTVPVVLDVGEFVKPSWWEE